MVVGFTKHSGINFLQKVFLISPEQVKKYLKKMAAQYRAAMIKIISKDHLQMPAEQLHLLQ